MVGGGGACDQTTSNKCYHAAGGDVITKTININTEGKYLIIGIGGQESRASGTATSGFGYTANGGHSQKVYNVPYDAGVFAFNDSNTDSQLYGGNMNVAQAPPNYSGKGSYNNCENNKWFKGGSGVIIIRNHR